MKGSSVVFDSSPTEEYNPVDNLSYNNYNYGGAGAGTGTGAVNQPFISNSNDKNNMKQTHHPIGGRMFSSTTPFGDGGFADEPPLMEELGINFSHMSQKVFIMYGRGNGPDIISDTYISQEN